MTISSRMDTTKHSRVALPISWVYLWTVFVLWTSVQDLPLSITTLCPRPNLVWKIWILRTKLTLSLFYFKLGSWKYSSLARWWCFWWYTWLWRFRLTHKLLLRSTSSPYQSGRRELIHAPRRRGGRGYLTYCCLKWEIEYCSCHCNRYYQHDWCGYFDLWIVYRLLESKDFFI